MLVLFFQCFLARPVQWSCVGGLVVGKLKFFIMFLVICIFVQTVQVHFEHEKQRQYWRDLCVEVDLKRAQGYVMTPALLAKGLSLLCGGPVLAALAVAGALAGAYWLFKHGDEEAYMNFHHVDHNGTTLDKDGLYDLIAARNGINTQGAVWDLDPSDGSVTSLDPHLSEPMVYTVGSLLASNFYNVYSDTLGRQLSSQYSTLNSFGAYNANSSYPKAFVGSNGFYVFQDITWSATYGVNYVRYKKYSLISSQPAPSAYDPDNYPEIFEGTALMQQCLALYQSAPDDFDIYYTSSPTPPDATPYPIMTPVEIVGKEDNTSSNSTSYISPGGVSYVDNYGNTGFWKASFPEYDLPEVDPQSTEKIKIGNESVAVPKSYSDMLTQAGIRGKITGVGKGWVEWEDEEGHRYTTRVSTDVSTKVAEKVEEVAKEKPTVITEYPGLSKTDEATAPPDYIDPTAAEKDPGDPTDPQMAGNGTFDTSFNYGNATSYDVNEKVNQIEQLPMVQKIKNAEVSATNPNPVISITMSSWPGGSRTLSVDFSQWESIFDVMGAFIYVMSFFYAVTLALLGRKV